MNQLYFFLTCLLLLFNPSKKPDQPEITFNHVALSVKNADRSGAFYSEIIHLEEITNRTEVPGIRWFSLGEGKELHLISILDDPVQTNKAIHFALTTNDFDGFLKRLKESGVTYSDWPGTTNKVNIRADGIRQVFFQDPDGNWIEMNSTASN